MRWVLTSQSDKFVRFFATPLQIGKLGLFINLRTVLWKKLGTVLIVSWNQIMVFVASYCGNSLCLTFLCIKFSTWTRTSMISFKFDICHCLSFPTYEIWSASAIFCQTLIDADDNFGQKGSLHFFSHGQYFSRYFKGWWFLMIFCLDHWPYYVFSFSNPNVVLCKLGKATVHIPPFVPQRWFYFLRFSGKSWNKSGFCSGPTVQPHLSSPDEVGLSRKDSSKNHLPPDLCCLEWWGKRL